MKWVVAQFAPRPSLRTVALVGAIAAFFVARNNHKSFRRLAG